MPEIDQAMMVAVQREVVDCKLGDGTALLDLKSNIYFGLNEVGTFVWSKMSQPISFGQLCHMTADEFGAGAEQVNDDLANLVRRMDDAGLVRCYRE